MSTDVKTPYEKFLAKQQARKEAALARMTKKSQTLDKETSAKYIPTNLKIMANYTVGNVQDVTNAKDVAVVKVENEDGSTTVTKKPAMYLHAEQANDLQITTSTDMVTAPAIAVYASVGDPNKLILVTDKENVNKYDLNGMLADKGLEVIAHQIAPVQFLSEASDVAGKTASMTIWATESNELQVTTVKDDISYILVKENEEDKDVEKYVLTDSFDAYNQMGEPNKLIEVTEKEDVLNNPVVEETVESSSSTPSSSEAVQEPTVE